jgi:hypothetical protein
MTITDTPAFRAAYAAVERLYYPHGIPAYADLRRVRFRVADAALDLLRRSGVDFDGDPEIVAREYAGAG